MYGKALATGSRLMLLGITAVGLAWGCAAAEDTSSGGVGSGGSTPTVTATNTTTGAVGGSGTVGNGGAGGSDLCAIDCSTVPAPDCNFVVCNDGTYPGQVGTCVFVPEADGATCDDGLFCTANDSCVAGQCEAGPANDCGLTPSLCQDISCDETADSCTLIAANEGLSCPSPDLCTVNTVCQAGVCGGGGAKDCTFTTLPEPDECYTATCNPANGMCEPMPGNDGVACDDPNDLCTVSKTCSAGACTGGLPRDCSALTVGCTMGVCDAGTGMCQAQAAGEGMACDDLDACSMGEICTAGNCGGGAANTTCSMTGDGCCPSNCTAANDFDCNCPGSMVNGTCVYTPNIGQQHATEAEAQTACQALGTGWGLCSQTNLCDPGTYSYLDMAGCDCTGGASACNCTGINLYFWITGSRHYLRQDTISGCTSGNQCTPSTSQSGCANAICCK